MYQVLGVTVVFLDTLFQILKEFLYLTLSVSPYFLMGAAFSSALQTYLKGGFVSRYVGKGAFSLLNASVLGAVLPGCACATIPMAEGLKRLGAGLGTVTAFIMISPLLSPITVLITYGMLGWEITVARVFFSFVGALLIGLVLNGLERYKVAGFGIKTHNPRLIRGLTVREESCYIEENQGFFGNLISTVRGLLRYFLIGMLIASVLTTLVPEGSFSRYMVASGVLAYVVAAFVGIPLYVCEGEEVPITFALLKMGLGVGPAFTFLMGSVGTCLPTIIMAQKIIGKRAVLLYTLSWFVFAMGSGFLVSKAIL